MTLGEFLKKYSIANVGLIEYRLVDHEDYADWKDSEHFPGYSGKYRIENNQLTIVADFDDDTETISLDTQGTEDTLDEVTGFAYLANNEQVKLVFG